ncbi:hypothetical protein AB3Y40_02750 [Yoonia sp. R2331]|uniref:hypothetical protein n=1 Tax=Yoonia sp. R2331 TaxID=3237238 RepID=UPI0034E57693
MRSASLVFSAAALALSGCAATVVGPTMKAQEDAIFACAKEQGDAIFPIQTRARVELTGGTQRASVVIVPTERLSQGLADRINDCAASRLPAVATPVTEVSGGLSPAARVRTPVAQSRSASCPAGASVIYGGSQYCTGR